MALIVDDRTQQTDHRLYTLNPNGYQWLGLILHHTGSANEEGDWYWLSHYHADPVSVQKMIRRNGTITKIVRENLIAFHAGYSRYKGRDGCNSFMMGYEICNRGTGSERYSDAQYESVALSVAYDCARYHISDDWVTSHKMVRDLYLAAHPMKGLVFGLLAASPLPTDRFGLRLGVNAIARKNDPIGWDWARMWRRVDQIRSQWPADWDIPLWFKAGPRTMTT